MRILTSSALVLAVALALAACTTTNEIEGHQIRADGQAVTTTTYSPAIAAAPQWFRDGWRRYLNDADGRYAVLAVDRNARGWGYVYCRGAGCHRLDGAGHRSWKDAQYRHRALESCRENVRNYAPAHRPNCEIYAI